MLRKKIKILASIVMIIAGLLMLTYGITENKAFAIGGYSCFIVYGLLIILSNMNIFNKKN